MLDDGAMLKGLGDAGGYTLPSCRPGAVGSPRSTNGRCAMALALGSYLTVGILGCGTSNQAVELDGSMVDGAASLDASVAATPKSDAAVAPGADGAVSTPDGGAVLPDVSCTNSLDCVGVSEGRTICDPALRSCVVCTQGADCPESHDCMQRVCVEYTSCVNSLDCVEGEVCDGLIKRCVQCETDVDCDADYTCSANTCRKQCQSDNECTAMGLLCDSVAGYCAQCVQHVDCDEAQYCAQGRCAPDLCIPYTKICAGPAIVSCTAAGDGTTDPVACGDRQTCVQSADSAGCEDWVCTAGQTECAADELHACSEDGLDVVSSTDCASQGQLCVASECRTAVCSPSTQFCDGMTLRLCDNQGLSSSVVSTCSGGQYCDAATAACVTGVCSPGQSACDGSTATACNSVGDGYEVGGTDCALDSRVCVSGVCQLTLCTADQVLCSDGDVKRCNSTGTELLTETICDVDQYCAAGACMAQICEPNSLFCSGTDIRRCDAPGSMSSVEQACGSNQVCDDAGPTCMDVPDGGVPMCEPAACPTCSILAPKCCTSTGVCGCGLLGLSCS